MKLRRSKAACCLGATLVVMMMPVLPKVTDAKPTYEQHESTITDTEIRVASYAANVEETVLTVQEETKGQMHDKALAITDPYLDVYQGMDSDSEVVGRLYKNTEVDVLQISEGWTKISSGNCEGYTKTAALLFGQEAEAITASISEEDILTGYTLEEAEAMEAEAEAARIAEEERIAAEAEAARKAEEARVQSIISNTISGSDITYNPTMSVSDEELYLLACIIDWEANSESYEGKLAVANVVLNRVRSSAYPNSISGVIYQRSQFSGVSDGAGSPSAKFQSRINSGLRSQACMDAAVEALSGHNNIGGYTSFRMISAANISSMSSYVIIGNHVFH